MDTPLYPVNLKLEGVPCVVVGGGEVAFHKARALLDSGARLCVVAPRLNPGLQQLHRESRFHWIDREYREGDLRGARLVVCATDQPEVNREVYGQGRSEGALVNVVDVPELCDFHVPSVVRRGDLMLTVSTGGKCPGLSRRLRRRLEGEFGPEHAAYLELLSEARQALRGRVAEPARRLELMNALLEVPVRLETLCHEPGVQALRKKLAELLPEPPTS